MHAAAVLVAAAGQPAGEAATGGEQRSARLRRAARQEVPCVRRRIVDRHVHAQLLVARAAARHEGMRAARHYALRQQLLRRARRVCMGRSASAWPCPGWAESRARAQRCRAGNSAVDTGNGRRAARGHAQQAPRLPSTQEAPEACMARRRRTLRQSATSARRARLVNLGHYGCRALPRAGARLLVHRRARSQTSQRRRQRCGRPQSELGRHGCVDVHRRLHRHRALRGDDARGAEQRRGRRANAAARARAACMGSGDGDALWRSHIPLPALAALHAGGKQSTRITVAGKHSSLAAGWLSTKH